LVLGKFIGPGAEKKRAGLSARKGKVTGRQRQSDSEGVGRGRTSSSLARGANQY